MKSIRLSLTVYFLALLALALGTASLLAYQTAYLTLQEKKQATEKLIQTQYDDRCRDETTQLDQRLLDQAEALVRLVRYKVDLAQQQLAQMQRKAQFVGLLTALPSPNGYAQVLLWKGQSFQPEWKRGQPPPHDYFADLYRKPPQIKLNLDDPFLPHAVDEELAEYYQIDAPFGTTFQSEKLGKRTLPLDTLNFKPNELEGHEFNTLDLMPDNAPVRRVILKRPSGLPNPRSSRRSGPPSGRPAEPTPPEPGVFGPVIGPPIYIQCATSTDNLDKRLQGFRDNRDAELGNVEAETKASLAGLRNRLLGMSLMTFAVITFGTWWLVRLGLLPLERLSDAVSKVSEKDFKLHFDEPRLPAELRPIHERLTVTLEQLQRAFAREKQATADISHELRTPLAALLTTMELALRKTRTADEYREMFQDCLTSAKHMNKVVERLLALARLDAGVDALRPRQVDVGELAFQCASMVRPLAEARGLNLTVQRRGGAEATVDPDKMREMMINLLHNAIQYNRPNGSITLTVARENGTLEMAVSDTGIGIAPDKQARIFERFFRADPSRGADGLHAGLGLAIVKGYVDLMHGSLDVESAENQGTTFRIRLPMPHESGNVPRELSKAQRL